MGMFTSIIGRIQTPYYWEVKGHVLSQHVCINVEC